MTDIPLDPDRLNRVHIVNVRYSNSDKAYKVILIDPREKNPEEFEIDWETWKTFGDWRQRKKEGNYY